MFKRTLSVRSPLKGAAFEMHLHRAAGVYAAVVLLSTAFAAWTFTFEWARAGLYAITLSAAPARKPVSSAAPGDATPSTLEAFLARTLEAVPQADQITLVLPRKPRDAVEVQVIERDAPHPNARTVVYLDRHTAQVLRVEPYATSSAGHKAYRWLASLHMGYVGGVAGQLVQAAAMWMVPFLLVTGIRSHLRKRRAPAR
jgi:vanillate O-demethylase ferredoxin subunit